MLAQLFRIAPRRRRAAGQAKPVLDPAAKRAPRGTQKIALALRRNYGTIWSLSARAK